MIEPQTASPPQLYKETNEDLNRLIKWGPLGKDIFERTYSLNKPDGTKETWPETISRAIRGNLGLVDPKHIEEGEGQALFDLLFSFAVIPAGRHLRASGVKGRQFLYNCHSSGFDSEKPWEHFTFMFDALMQGGGVGSNYSNRYIEIMKPVSNKVELLIVCDSAHPNYDEIKKSARNKMTNLLDGLNNWRHNVKYYNIDDSREGWVDALRLLLSTFWAESGPVRVILDVSSIRPRGAPLVTSGGIACGPGPLVESLINAAGLLNKSVGKKLSSMDSMNLDHALAKCVVAGGIRRSSRIAVKSWKDEDIFDFIACKSSDGAHFTTNISVEVDDEFISEIRELDPRATKISRMVAKHMMINGEPGYWNRSLAMQGERDPELMFTPNPCGEIGLREWDGCNLGHVNLEYFANKPPKNMYEAFRLISRWLVRATNGDLPYYKQRKVVDETRRIGVGFFGFNGWLALNGIKYSDCWKNDIVKKMLKTARKVVEETSDNYAIELGIPTPIKHTALAPTGTTAMLPGVDGSGQAKILKRGKRRVRYANGQPTLLEKKRLGYPTYPDPDNEDSTTIVEFWFEDPLVQKMKISGLDPDAILEDQEDVHVHDSLEIQAMLQELYADNAISFTINLPSDKESQITLDELESEILTALPRIKGTTVFPANSRANAPFERVTKEEWDAYTGPKEIAQIEDECKNGCPVA